MKNKKLISYVALLRAINVGGKNVIKMEALRAEFENAGFEAVTSYIQSGNILFQTPLNKHVQIIEKLSPFLKAKFKYEDLIVIRSKNEIEDTVSNFPGIFQDENWKHNVLFLSGTLDHKVILKRFELKKEIEKLSYAKGVLFWSAEKMAIARTTMVKLSSKKEYKEMTIRNINTTNKVLTLLRELDAHEMGI